MALSSLPTAKSTIPRARDVLELLKPITWFPPMWAFMCGVVSSGVSIPDRWFFMISGMILAGPLVCGAVIEAVLASETILTPAQFPSNDRKASAVRG